MEENNIICAKCGKPVMGYYTRTGFKRYCADCAKTVTLWDAALTGDLPLLPEIVYEQSPISPDTIDADSADSGD